MPLGSDEITEIAASPPRHRRPPPPSRRKAVLRAVGLIAVVVAWLAIAGLGGPAIGSLSTVQSNDQESFLPGAAESVQAAKRQRPSRIPAALPAFVIFETDGGAASPDQLASWNSFAQTLAAQPANPDKPALGTIGDYDRWPAPCPVNQCHSCWSCPRTGRLRWSWSRCQRTR